MRLASGRRTVVILLEVFRDYLQNKYFNLNFNIFHLKTKVHLIFNQGTFKAPETKLVTSDKPPSFESADPSKPAMRP